MSVGIEVVGPLGHARKKRAFLERELLRGFTKIAAGSELDAPGAATKIDGIEVARVLTNTIRCAASFLSQRRSIDRRRWAHREFACDNAIRGHRRSAAVSDRPSSRQRAQVSSRWSEARSIVISWFLQSGSSGPRCERTREPGQSS